MNGDVPIWEKFFDSVLEIWKSIRQKTYLFWKNQVKGMHEITVFIYR